ncbi:hypothetical protein [Roseovarius nanhaiticus]|uniref:hypothetical protein n=1 Tax=Roseovarius nanhaiticus TaxID=573024 RepID=UPI002492BEC8|nr:hypothetical protein [Roseovarius nanhaiticus]
MNEDRYTDDIVAQGEAELALCLEWLSAEGIIPVSIPTAGIYVPTFGRVSALIIHRRANGWVADILFADGAPGHPDVLGTSDSIPSSDRDDARKLGWQLVADLVLKNLSHHRTKSRVQQVQ